MNERSPRSKLFVQKLPDAFIDEARWIFIPQKCVFDEAKFCINLRIGIADRIGTMKKGVYQISLVTKRGKARKFCKVASACGFVIGTSFNSFVSFFDENIKKSQRVVRFYFLGKLNLTVHVVRITKKYLNRGGISKSSKTIVNIATKELWLMVQGRAFDRFINYIIHHDVS